MAGYKTIGDTSSGTAKALIRLGGAAGVMEVPAWADTLLGIYTHVSSSLPVTLEDGVFWGYLESDDGMSIKPFEFLYPPIAACLGATASTNSTPGEYWAINAPVRPLSKIITYGQWLSGAATTGQAVPGEASIMLTAFGSRYSLTARTTFGARASPMFSVP